MCVHTWVAVVERATVNGNSSIAHVHHRARTLRRGARLAPTIILTETTYAFTLHTHDEMCCLTVVCNVVCIGKARIGSPYPPLLSLYLFPSRSLCKMPGSRPHVVTHSLCDADAGWPQRVKLGNRFRFQLVMLQNHGKVCEAVAAKRATQNTGAEEVKTRKRHYLGIINNHRHLEPRDRSHISGLRNSGKGPVTIRKRGP